MYASPPARSFPQYQGGSSFPVFTAQGSNPGVNCKIFGKSVHKVYDKTVKGYVYNCLGGMSSKIQFPKDEKTGLQLVQPYLVLQIFVPKGQHFSLELRAADTQGTRRKMYLSTSFSELKANPLHCQIPLSMVMRNTWISLALDVPDLFQSCFRVLNFRSLDVIILGPVCKLRKIFTMRSRLAQSVLEAANNEECLPLEHVFAAGVEAAIQVIDTEKIHNLLGLALHAEGREVVSTPPMLTSQKKLLSKTNRHVNVAFGSRMPLTLSTIQINTNFSHNVDGSASHNAQASCLPNTTGTQVMLETLKVSDPKSCPSQTQVLISDTGKQRSLKTLDPKTFHNMPQNFCEGGTFPVCDKPSVDNIETNAAVINRCLDLTSKHGKKLQNLKKKMEVKIPKHHHLVRHTQKENSKSREDKEMIAKDSPPGSPPSAWDNNSDECSDGFLSEHRFAKIPRSANSGTLACPYSDFNPFIENYSHNQESQTMHENRCITSEGDSCLEKTLCNAENRRSELQDPGELVKHNEPFGSTEELWIVHEEGDFGELPSNKRSNEEMLQLEGSIMRECTTQHLTTSNNISPAATNFDIPNQATKLTSLLISKTGHEMKRAELVSARPLPSKAEDKELDLLYDPILDCYYDPKTNRYYELR